MTIDQLRTLSNHQIFISFARGLHQFYDSGGISMGRSYQTRLFEAFYFRLELGDIPPQTLLTGELFHHDGIILGHIQEERQGKTARVTFTEIGKLEELSEEVFTYLLLQKIGLYYESGQAEEEGWLSRMPFNYCKAMRLMLELDYDFSNIKEAWTSDELIAEGGRRLNAKLG